jgi:cation transport regulator ChaC
VEPSAVPEVIAQLNQRETSAYITREVTFFPKDTLNQKCATQYRPFSVLVYIGTESSFGYLGPASIEAIAEQILRCSGKSGTNAEYVLKLASTMREIAPNIHDKHLFSLEKKILDLPVLQKESQGPRHATEQRDVAEKHEKTFSS